MDVFREIALECHKDRIEKQELQSKSLKTLARQEYAMFSVWCRVNQKIENENSFKEYIKVENKNLDFWMKKQIFEMYFNYEFEFDFYRNRWITKKINAT